MLEKIRDKQRVIITGSEGTQEIFEVVKKVMSHAQKPFIAFSSEDQPVNIGDEPVAIILCTDEHLLDFEHHIALVTAIKDKEHKDDYDNYIRTYEKFLDSSPKAGCIIYNVEDSASALIGKKDREDVVQLEYGKPAVSGNEMEVEKMSLPMDKLTDSNPTYLKGAYTLLKRIGIKEEEFIAALS